MALDIPSKRIPISRISDRYYLFDLSSVSFLRTHHNVLGTFVGTLPQHSQQNVFLGLPLQLLAEETRMLVEKRVAYIVDDEEVHTKGLKQLSLDDRERYKRGLEKRGHELAKADQDRRAESTKDALDKMGVEQRTKVLKKSERKGKIPPPDASGSEATDTDALFAPSSPTTSTAAETASVTMSSRRPKCITPTTSQSLISLPSPPGSPLDVTKQAVSASDQLPTPPSDEDQPQLDTDAQASARSQDDSLDKPFSPFSQKREPKVYPKTPIREIPPVLPPPNEASSLTSPQSSKHLPPERSQSAYILYRYLHDKGYFQSPGLRFGCHFCVYPGDPLRFHSHFLARGYGWDEEIRLMDIVGGGRLGTGVKKGYLIGGPIGKGSRTMVAANEEGTSEDAQDDVRAFCIEWAGM